MKHLKLSKFNILSYSEYISEEAPIGDWAHSKDLDIQAVLDLSTTYDDSLELQEKFKIFHKTYVVRYNHTKEHDMKRRINDRSKGYTNVEQLNELIDKTIRRLVLVNGRILNLADVLPMNTKMVFVYPHWNFKMIITPNDFKKSKCDFYIGSFYGITYNVDDVDDENHIHFDFVK
jgi:DNA replicative helicase MCM subunit Mcm2 (Cdc46/Mcm family)